MVGASGPRCRAQWFQVRGWCIAYGPVSDIQEIPQNAAKKMRRNLLRHLLGMKTYHVRVSQNEGPHIDANII